MYVWCWYECVVAFVMDECNGLNGCTVGPIQCIWYIQLNDIFYIILSVLCI